MPALSAQVREVSGRVTNEQTGQGVGEAVVSVEGTRIAVRSSADGRFVFNVPDGDQRLTVRAIGFKRDSVTVPALERTVTVALEPDPFKLEEVVVTGQSTGIEKRNLPNAVATVSASELTRAPTGTLESALQGKIPGALIQANSGAPGGGIQVNLRGVSTITGDVNNLFVIDGVVVSNDAIPNGANAVTAAQSGGAPQNQDNPVNRIADLNPEDIERIEVLKGGSAAAIYGSKANNGVVIITTKRGQQGKPQFNLTQRIGTFWRANELGRRTFGSLAEVQSRRVSTLPTRPRSASSTRPVARPSTSRTRSSAGAISPTRPPPASAEAPRRPSTSFPAWSRTTRESPSIPDTGNNHSEPTSTRSWRTGSISRSTPT